MFNNSGPSSKRTQKFFIPKINLLMLFKELNAIYTENNMKSINTKCTVADC
jgi:hypothetical protein